MGHVWCMRRRRGLCERGLVEDPFGRASGVVGDFTYVEWGLLNLPMYVCI